MIEDAAHDEIESQFDGMGYRGGEPEVTSVEVQSVTVTESGIETFEEEIEKELEGV
jgi:hypothetical protein